MDRQAQDIMLGMSDKAKLEEPGLEKRTRLVQHSWTIIAGANVGRSEDGTANINQRRGNRNLDIPFDPTATEARQASVANSPVTQDIDLVRLDEEAFTEDIAGGSTREYLQLLRPWDVWITQASSRRKGQVYMAREGDYNVQDSRGCTGCTSMAVQGTYGEMAWERGHLACMLAAVIKNTKDFTDTTIGGQLGLGQRFILRSEGLVLANSGKAVGQDEERADPRWDLSCVSRGVRASSGGDQRCAAPDGPHWDLSCVSSGVCVSSCGYLSCAAPDKPHWELSCVSPGDEIEVVAPHKGGWIPQHS